MEAEIVIIATRCHYCQKFRSPIEINRLPGGVVICFRCVEWHGHANKVLAGEIPKGCQECGRDIFSLFCDTKHPENENTYMRLVVKDGIYQLLCEPCAAEYRLKRKEFYRGTEFGERMKI